VSSFKLHAIILKRANFGEADRMLTVFSLEKGKISLVAKGVRRIKSRRAPHLEPLNNVEIVTHKKIITEAKSSTRPKLKLSSLGLALYAVEVIDKLLPDEQPHEEVYELLKNLLAQEKLDENQIKIFTTQVLWSLGFFPKGQYPKDGINNFVEQIAEKRIRSKKLWEEIQ
jgi:DNA repair protein RecO (recombination protein O)